MACVVNLPRQSQVVVVELADILREGDVAGADASVPCLHDDVDGKSVECHQPLPDGHHVEFPYAAGCPPDAPAQEHIELHAPSSACPHQPPHSQGLEECHHRHRGLHPHLESPCTACFLRIDFTHSCNICTIKGLQSNISCNQIIVV